MEPSLLVHGPMVGQVTDNSASFWFRTDGPCEVAVKINGHSGSNRLRRKRKTDMLALSKSMDFYRVPILHTTFL